MTSAAFGMVGAGLVVGSDFWFWLNFWGAFTAAGPPSATLWERLGSGFGSGAGVGAGSDGCVIAAGFFMSGREGCGIGGAFSRCG